MRNRKQTGFGTGLYLLLLAFIFGGIVSSHAQWKLDRTYTDYYTVGVLKYGDIVITPTIEKPWNDNKVRVSAIPEGTYIIEFKFYGKFHEKWKDRPGYKGVPILRGVEGRSEILIHPASHVGHVLGCIGIMQNFWDLYDLLKDGDTISISS